MTIQAWIRALPPDAITTVTNAHAEAYDAALEAGAPWSHANGAAAFAFRDALLSLAPPEVAADGLTPAVRAANAKNEGKRAFDDGVADGMEPEDALDMALGVAVGLATDAVDELRRFAEGDTRPVPQTYMTAGAAAREATPSGPWRAEEVIGSFVRGRSMGWAVARGKPGDKDYFVTCTPGGEAEAIAVRDALNRVAARSPLQGEDT